MPFCPKCGKEIEQDAVYCQNCGSLLAQQPNQPTTDFAPSKLEDFSSKLENCPICGGAMEKGTFRGIGGKGISTFWGPTDWSGWWGPRGKESSGAFSMWT